MRFRSPLGRFRSAVRNIGSSIISPGCGEGRRADSNLNQCRRTRSEGHLTDWKADRWSVSTRSIRGFMHSARWNEDAFTVTQDLFAIEGAPNRPPLLGKVGLFAVFDGHGGRECSDFIASVMPAAVVQSPAWEKVRLIMRGGEEFVDDNDTTAFCPSIPFNGDREELLRSVLIQALEDGFRTAEVTFEEYSSGTGLTCGSTGVVALMCDNWLAIANVGDSGALYFNHGDIKKCSQEPLIVQTKLHDYQNMEERSRVEKAGGYFSRGRLLGQLEPSRSFGDLDMRRLKDGALISTPEIITQRICPTDGNAFLVMATDGLWDCVSPEKVIKLVQSGARRQVKKKAGDKPVQVAASLTRAAQSAEEGDDVTVVVVLIG
ncbi:unnamed protein product [Discosporangium mesarthrocarpum]